MTDIDIRDALLEIRDAIPVPPLDAAAVRSRVRAARRRRTRAQVVGAVAAVAVVAAAASWVHRELEPRGTDPSLPVMVVDLDPALPFPYVDGNELFLALPDGSTVETGVGAQEVFGQSSDQVVLSSNDSRLTRVSFDARGRTGEPQDLAPAPVSSVALSQDGTRVAYVDLDDTLHLRDVGAPISAPDLATATVDRGSQLVDTDQDAWLLYSQESQVLTLHRWTAGAESSVTIDISEGMLTQAELAGDIVAVPILSGGVRTFDATTGKLRGDQFDDSFGSLSPDGRHYASGNDQPGETPVVVDLGDGRRTPLTGLAADQYVWRVVWQGNTRFYIGGSGETGHTLWSCTVNATCARLSALTGETVELPNG